MSAAPQLVLRAGDELAQERLSAYTKYAEAVALQEAALEVGDLERFEALARVAERVQSELATSQGLRELLHDQEADSDWFVDRITELVRTTLARNERIRARLARLRRPAGGEIHSAAAEQRPSVRSYTGGSEPDRPEHTLDMRF